MEIRIRPADGESYANGVIVGHVVPIGEVAHTIQAMTSEKSCGHSPDIVDVLVQVAHQDLRKQVVEARENLTETTASWKFEKDRADALAIDVQAWKDSTKFEKNRADRAVTELNSLRGKVEGYDLDRHTERDRADKNREWAERVEKELDASKAYIQQLRTQVSDRDGDLAKVSAELMGEENRADELVEVNRTLSSAKAQAQIARDEARDRLRELNAELVVAKASFEKYLAERNEARDQLAEFKEKYAKYNRNFQQQIAAATDKARNLSILVDVQRERLTAIEKLVLDPDLIKVLVAWRKCPDNPTEMELAGANLIRSIRDKFGLPPVATAG